MLRIAIEKGDLQRGQELLQIAKKRQTRMISSMTNSGDTSSSSSSSFSSSSSSSSSSSKTDYLREVGMIESMVSQSRSQRKLSEMTKLPMSDVWRQRQLLQSLVAEARTGDVSSTQETTFILERGAAMLLICEDMEQCVLHLSNAMETLSSSDQGDQNKKRGGSKKEERTTTGSSVNLGAAISRAEELTTTHGNFCMVTLNDAKSMMDDDGGHKLKQHKRYSSTAPAFVPLLQQQRQRLLHKYEQQKNQQEREKRLKKEALEALEKLTAEVRNKNVKNSSNEHDLIEMLANVVMTVEKYATTLSK